MAGRKTQGKKEQRNCSEERREAERARVRTNRESFSEERRQAERDRARMNRQGNAKEKYKDKENGSKK